MSWRPGRSGSFRRFETVLDKVPIEVRLLIEEIEESSTLLFSNRSGIHLDGSSFRLSSSRNQSDDDSSDTKPGVCLLQYGQWHELIIPSLLWKFLYELSCYSCYSCYPDMSSVVTASSTTRSFLRMRPSSGNSSDGGKKQNKVAMMPWWSINVVCQEQVPEAMAPPQQTLFPLFRSPGEAPSDLLGTARSVFSSFELNCEFLSTPS